MAVELGWTRTAADIPTWDLNVDPTYYVEQWGLGSWAAYSGDVALGEPGTFGTREEAQEYAEDVYRESADAERKFDLQFACTVYASYQAQLDAAGESADAALVELTRRAKAELDRCAS